MRIKILIAASFMMHFSLYSEEPRFMVEIEAEDALTRSKIASYISIDSIIGDRVYSVVNGFDLDNLRANTGLEILTLEVLNEEKVSSYFESFFSDVDTDPEFPRGDEAFHTFKEIETELKQMADAHSGIAQVFSIGKSVEGRDIWALRISDGSEPKPGIAYLGTHHAREHVSTEIPFMFAKELLDRSISDNEIKDLLKKTEIFIIPLVNPDGATFDITNKRYKYWRKNRKPNGGSYGVDLNRNYGYGWGTGGSSSNPRSDIYMGKAPFSEPETQSIKDFFLAHKNITIALTFHTYSELILYPWGGKNDPVPGKDGDIFKKMANDMAKMNHYTPEQSSDLYIASGDTCDWLYGELSVYCFTFELSPSSEGLGGFYPDASIIPKVYKDNLEPMLYLLRFAGNPASVLE